MLHAKQTMNLWLLEFKVELFYTRFNVFIHLFRSIHLEQKTGELAKFNMFVGGIHKLSYLVKCKHTFDVL